MTTIVTRSGKGAALTHTEVDANFTNLNTNKAEVSTVLLASEKGAASGVCPLDSTSKVSSTYLPSYVDDVLEYANYAALPATGETGKIYVALDTNKTYRWSGSAYVYITSGAVDSVAGKTGVVTLTSTDVGLGNVTNTSDANKPISTATQTALNLKAPIASPTFTGTVSGISKVMVGLGNVDNTTDAGKPISTATQTALDLKAPIASPTFTGTVSGISKVMVGLGNVDNTTDAGKPVSTATQTALDLKAPLASPTLSNPAYTGTLTGSTGVLNIGSGQVYKDVSGNVGIGTASPTQKLDVNGAIKCTTPAQFDNTTTVPTTAFVQRALGNYSSVIQTVGVVTLTAANAGQLIVIGGGTTSITLPLLSATLAGTKLYFEVQSSTTISRQGADNIFSSTTGHITSISPVGSDTTIELTNYSSVWYITGGTYLQKITTVPQVTTYISGSGTYTPPSNVKYLIVKMAGGGGGGAGGGTTGATAGGTGGTTTFGTSLMTCTGGVGGSVASSSSASAGGTATNTLGTGVAFTGSQGVGGNSYNVAGYAAGMAGGVSPFGGGGASSANGSGTSATNYTGSGAGGGGSTASGLGAGGGGAAGGYIEGIILAPAASYSFAIGSGGTAGSAGTNGYVGGVGASGIIYISAYF